MTLNPGYEALGSLFTVLTQVMRLSGASLECYSRVMRLSGASLLLIPGYEALGSLFVGVLEVSGLPKAHLFPFHCWSVVPVCAHLSTFSQETGRMRATLRIIRAPRGALPVSLLAIVLRTL